MDDQQYNGVYLDHKLITFLNDKNKFQSWVSSLTEMKLSDDIIILLAFLATEAIATLAKMVICLIEGDNSVKKLFYTTTLRLPTNTFLDGNWLDSQLHNPDIFSSFYLFSVKRKSTAQITIDYIKEALRRLAPNPVSLSLCF